MIIGIHEDGSRPTFLSRLLLSNLICQAMHVHTSKSAALYIRKTSPLMKTPGLGLKHLVIGKFQLSVSHIYTTGTSVM